MIVLSIVVGTLVVLGLTALTGYFVAQEFGYMAVDRSRLNACAADGDDEARRALLITRRTSFMLSGAQLGITVTGLLVGYVAEPMVGAGVGELLGGVGISKPVGVVIGTLLALLFATLVQMVFGELFPKNLAIARPEPVARRLAGSTAVYLRVFGGLIWVFDQAASLLLRTLRIEPVHDVEHAATPRDLEHIVAESRDSGDLPADLSVLLDRVLDFGDRTARQAMTPRTRVTTVAADAPSSVAMSLMATGVSRIPVRASGLDDIVGVICLRDVLALPDPASVRVSDLARPAVLVPSSLPLPRVLRLLRDVDEELACVIDEYGGLAGVISVEDIAEELVGEIADEHDPAEAETLRRGPDGDWVVPGALDIGELERLLGGDLPTGPFDTVGGLVMDALGRLPEPGDRVSVQLFRAPDNEDTPPETPITLTVAGIERRVPSTVRVSVPGAGTG